MDKSYKNIIIWYDNEIMKAIFMDANCCTGITEIIFYSTQKESLFLITNINIIILMLVYWFLDPSKVSIGVTHTQKK